MASHRSNSLYAIKECMTYGSLYTRECCSIGSLEDKILTPVSDSSLCWAKCGTPVDGPYCRGCDFLRKKFGKDLLTYCGENETSKDFEDIFESSDDNTNVVNTPREPIVVNQYPGLMEQMTSICDMVGQIMQKKEEERRIVEEQAAKEDMSIEEMRHEQQLVDYKIKDIITDMIWI
ncbi:hypothetical protein Tco_0969690 [Tanacetum coccineum]